jgi:hypothetical protein
MKTVLVGPQDPQNSFAFVDAWIREPADIAGLLGTWAGAAG